MTNKRAAYGQFGSRYVLHYSIGPFQDLLDNVCPFMPYFQSPNFVMRLSAETNRDIRFLQAEPGETF